ncbi:MAG TPA: hypothetical protein VLI72_15415 [Methylibium sp.]|nr:hypothetical protein [Methylibium sp.]
MSGAARRLLQIRPPGSGGVRDYADCLQARWQRLGVDSEVMELAQDAARRGALADRLGDTDRGPWSVVLHYSGYGYGRRGLCFWLLDELDALRRRLGGRLRLVVVFHELYASGPPWRSAFWLSPLQARIARALARRADGLWTNADDHAVRLAPSVRSAEAVQVWPVFSNVGEPDAAGPPAGARAPRAIVFGAGSTRQRVFDALHGKEALLARLGLVEIVEVGPGPASAGAPATVAGRHAGRLEAPALSRLLLESRWGLLDYPAPLLGKSSVFAAYAAHGCAVIDTRPPGPDADGLQAGRDYLALRALAQGHAPCATATAALGQSARRWYDGHRLERQAAALLRLAGIDLDRAPA